MIDTFATEYSWRKEDVLNLYMEEIPLFQRIIEKRNNMKMKKDLHAMAQAAIVPHLPKDKINKFFRELEREAVERKQKKITKEELHKQIGKLKSVLI